MFFKKKIIVTEEMKQTLQSFDEIPWASCCGIPYKKESYYPYIQETSQASVEKILKHTMNYSDTVCLVNLFKEGVSRADAFILQAAGWRFYQNTFLPCVKASWLAYEKRIKKGQGLDLNLVEKNFLNYYGFDNAIGLHLSRLLQYLLVEQYFRESFPQFPLFFSQIIDIYKAGHIVIGWKGKFNTHEVDINSDNGKPILSTDGRLIIW